MFQTKVLYYIQVNMVQPSGFQPW